MTFTFTIHEYCSLLINCVCVCVCVCAGRGGRVYISGHSLGIRAPKPQAGALQRAAQQGQLSHTQLCLLFPGVTRGEGRTLQRRHVGQLCARKGGQGQRGQVGKAPRGAGTLRTACLPSGDHCPCPQGLRGFVFTPGLRRCCAFYK